MPQPQDDIHYCHISGVPLSPERVEALQFLGVPEDRYTSVEVANRTVGRKRAAIHNEDGDFMVVDRLEDDVPLSVMEDTEEAKGETVVDPGESIPPPPPTPPPVDEQPVRPDDPDEE